MSPLPHNRTINVLERATRPAGRTASRRTKLTAATQITDDIVAQYAPLVRHVASKVFAANATILEFDDLVSYGMIGLIQAVERFDDSNGAGFTSFAIPRIRGAMIDAIRSVDPLPRGVRRRSIQLAQAGDVLSQELGRTPNEVEVAAGAGLTLEQARSTRAVWELTETSLELVTGADGDGNDGVSLGELLADPLAQDPSAPLEQRELLTSLASAIAALPERDLLVISLYYKEELSMREIALVLGISESRVSQLHHRALARLRSAMTADGLAAA
jgi:RNA polymerase sigma factor for flagellar operon FliA